jgi:Rieske Fe-S protein
MARCDVCGNDYDKAFRVTTHENQAHTFDSFECAISALAPICSHCGCRIIGHGAESSGEMFCCAHCASEHGIDEIRDRAG